MNKDKMEIRISSRGIANFKRILKYQLPKTDLKKVPHIVETFLNEDSDRSQLLINKAEPGKVTNAVGIFLNKDNDSFQISATKVEPEKVTDTVGTFSTNEIPD